MTLGREARDGVANQQFNIVKDSNNGYQNDHHFLSCDLLIVASHPPSLSLPRAGESTQNTEPKMYLLRFSVLLFALLNPTPAVVSTLSTASSSNVSNPTVDFPYKNGSNVIKISTNSSLTNASLSNVSASAADDFAQSEGTEQ